MFSSVISRLNDRRDAAADLGEDAGFTLIELMVVLLILAILLAIAIPTFLGVTGGANDRAAQSNLNTGLTTAKTQETQNGQSYTTTGGGTADHQLPRRWQSNEPAISFVAGAVTAPGPVSVFVSPMAMASSWRRSRRAPASAGTPSTTSTRWPTRRHGLTPARWPAVCPASDRHRFGEQAPANQGDYYGKRRRHLHPAASDRTYWGSTFSAALLPTPVIAANGVLVSS